MNPDATTASQISPSFVRRTTVLDVMVKGTCREVNRVDGAQSVAFCAEQMMLANNARVSVKKHKAPPRRRPARAL